MALDPSIALSVKPVQIDDPVEQYGKVMTLKGLVNQQQMQANQLQDYQRQRNNETQLRDLFKKNTVMGEDGKVSLNKPALLGDLFQNQPEKALEYQAAWQKQDAEATKLKRETDNADLDNQVKTLKLNSDMLEHTVQLLSGSKDQASYTRNRTIAINSGYVKPEEVPELYDPAYVESQIAAITPVQVQKENEFKQKAYELQVKNQQENFRHNRATEGTAAAGLGLQRERLNFEKSKQDLIYDQPRGGVVDKRTRLFYETKDSNGQPMPQGSGKPLTESQGNAALYGKRAEKADQVLGGIGDGYSKMSLGLKQFVEGWPLVGTAANSATGDKEQQVDQAQRDFINALLRKESGAAIGKDEFANAKKQYFPQVGDSKAVIKQKAENRKTAIEGLRVMAGPGAQMMDDADNKRTNPPAPKPQQAQPVRIKSDADYQRLPSGAEFIDPNGVRRRKP